VKVTFESAEAAEAAIYASPQSILGHLVYAEPYHGIPPTRDEAVVDTSNAVAGFEEQIRSPTRSMRRHGRGGSISSLPRGFFNQVPNGGLDSSPPQSLTSSRTADTTTVASTTDTATISTGTVTGAAAVASGSSVSPEAKPESDFCRAIPTARKVRLLPAEQALLPQQSYTQRMLNHVPFLKWFSGSMIGNEVPRTDTGDFDWDKASLYWKLICWLDYAFGLFGGEILNADKDD
jgi:hypothetical protein